MFLAWKEIKHAKGKFSLIIAVVALVAYLVYFLTSLAYGLASSYTNGVNAWNADNIVLTSDSNDNIMMSMMTLDDQDAIDADEQARLGLFPAVISNPSAEIPEDTKEEIYAFGIDNGSFIAPDITLNAGEIVGDSSLKDLGYEVGTIVRVAGSDIDWTLVGFADKITYQTAPILYMTMETWMDYRFGGATLPVDVFSAVVTQGETLSSTTDLKVYAIQDFVAKLPGYSAQVLTFSIMIGFLIFIIAFVLGIFIFVLTIQKTSMFGVMKAQGISNGYIGGSVVMQTLILTFIGVFIGLALTLISGYFLAGTVPFAINVLFYVVITAAFFVFSAFGGLFSVRTVLKIDPRIAIG